MDVGKAKLTPYNIDTPVQDMPKSDKIAAGAGGKSPRETGTTVEGAESAYSKPVSMGKNEDKSAGLPDGYMSLKKSTLLEEELNKFVGLLFPNMGVNFTVHEGTGQIITHVVNRDTDEVVREFPAEQILDMIHSFTERLGIVMDTKV